MTRAPEEVTTSADTADLLEALRRRRGQRETAPTAADDEPELNPIALFDSLDDIDDDAEEPSDAAGAPESPGRKRRRGAMPSWDEIVFGARTDEH